MAQTTPLIVRVRPPSAADLLLSDKGEDVIETTLRGRGWGDCDFADLEAGLDAGRKPRAILAEIEARIAARVGDCEREKPERAD
jgi:hypothetical protein